MREPEDDDHVTAAAPPPGAMAAQGSYWDGETVYEADGSMGAVLADGGMPMGTEMTDGVRSSSRSSNQPARFNPSAPSTSQSFVSISDGLSKDTFVADNVRECKAIDAAAECVDTSEEHYQCNTTYHSFHQWVESRVFFALYPITLKVIVQQLESLCIYILFRVKKNKNG